MNLKYYNKHPLKAFRLMFYLIFGNTIGRLAYPDYIFKSKHFNRWGAQGWEWVTKFFFSQKICGNNRHVPWPCSPYVLVACPDNIIFDVNDLNNFTTIGTYFQAFGQLVIGKGTYIAANVGIITENHDIYDPDKRSVAEGVTIGEKCWIGMNAVILPGVVLGNHTVVGAGSIVTKSFPDGACVIAGNPAKILKYLNKKL